MRSSFKTYLLETEMRQQVGELLKVVTNKLQSYILNCRQKNLYRYDYYLINMLLSWEKIWRIEKQFTKASLDFISSKNSMQNSDKRACGRVNKIHSYTKISNSNFSYQKFIYFDNEALSCQFKSSSTFDYKKELWNSVV